MSDLKLVNESRYPDAEVEEIIRFVLNQCDLSARTTARVQNAPPRSGGHYSGRAGDRRRHRMPRWADGSRFRLLLKVGPEDWWGHDCPHVCWHSDALKRMALGRTEEVSPDGEVTAVTYDYSTARVYAHLRDLLDAGETHFGRWPIYEVRSWQEVLVHLVAHEAAHLIQYDRDRGAGNSEIFCEEFALQILGEWRARADLTSTTAVA